MTASRSRVSITGSDSGGAATATYPASARNAASAVSVTAPVIPGDPPTTSTEPAVYFVSPGVRRGTSRTISGSTRACSVVRCSSPMSADDDLAGPEPARSHLEPHLAAVERDGHGGIDGFPRHLSGRGVDARRDVHRHHRASRGVHRPDLRGRLVARRRPEAGAEQRVDHDVGLAEGTLLPACGAKELGCDPTVAAVRSAAADGRERPGTGESPQHFLGDRCTGPPHQLLDVVPLLRRPHLVGGVERLERPRSATTQTALASSRECDIERSIGPASTRSAHRSTRPESFTDGFGLPAISMSRQAKSRATPSPSAFPTASLPANRAA